MTDHDGAERVHTGQLRDEQSPSPHPPIEAIERLKEESADLTKALTGLTCGGSEFFIRKGDRYVADIEACVAWVRRRDQDAHKRWLEAAKKAASAEASLSQAQDRIKSLEAGLNEFADFADLIDAETEGFEDSDPVALVLVPDEPKAVEMMRVPILAFRQARALLSTPKGKGEA